MVDTKSDAFTSDLEDQVTTFYQIQENSKLESFYVPYVVVITENKEIYTHVATLPEHDARERKMTADEITKLSKNLAEIISKQ